MGHVLYALFVLVIECSAGNAAALWSVQFGPRWGSVPGAPFRVGRGAYRQSTVRRNEPRGTPPAVSWTCGIGMVWSALTSLVFAPMMLCVGAVTQGIGL